MGYKVIGEPIIFCTWNFVNAPCRHWNEVSREIESMLADKHKINKHLKAEQDIIKIMHDEHGWEVRPLIQILLRNSLKGIIYFCHKNGYGVTV